MRARTVPSFLCNHRRALAHAVCFAATYAVVGASCYAPDANDAGLRGGDVAATQQVSGSDSASNLDSVGGSQTAGGSLQQDNPNDAVAGTAGGANTKLTRVNLMSLLDRSRCFDVHAIGDRYDVGLYKCHDGTGQQFAVSDGLIRWTQNANLCLTPVVASQASQGNLSLTQCSGSAAQKWNVSAAALQHVSSGLCAQVGREEQVEPDNVVLWGIELAACDPNLAYQQWYLGAYRDGQAQDVTLTMKQKCSPEVYLLPYATTDGGARRVVARYGSEGNMLAFVRQAITENCNAMFLSPNEVKPVRAVSVGFDPNCTGGAYAHGRDLAPQVCVCSRFFQTVDESEMPLSLRLDALFHHELTHTYDVGYGKPSGIVEGYANLIVYRTGYLGYNKKVKGGNWTDGYSPAAYFLLWLDTGFVNKPVGERFTDVMQQQSRYHSASQDDPNWFYPWVAQQTGFTIDQLWSKYQASF